MPRPKLLVQSRTLALREDGRLRVVAVADTHSQPHPRAEELIAALEPDQILHAGDIGDLAVLDRLAAIAPTAAVRGNIDMAPPGSGSRDRAGELPDVLTIDVRGRSETIFELLLIHIAVYGPKLRADAARLAREQGASLVICGHSHVPFIGRDRGLGIFNPGSIGPRRFHLPIVFGVMDITPERVELRHIDCETGQRWLP